MKKIFKYLCWTLFILFLILAISVIVLKIRNHRFIGVADKAFVDYLNRNKMVLNGDRPQDEDLSLFFGEDFYKSQIVLLGEVHGYAEVQEVDKFLFLHLHQKKGTRFYVSEMDSVCADRLNEYLRGDKKDSLILKEVIEKVKKTIPQQAGKELFSKWSDIYDYNQQLPDSLKIEVIGVDRDSRNKNKITRDSAMVVNLMNTIKNRGLENESFYGLFGLMHVLQDEIVANSRSFASGLKLAGFDMKSLVCLDIDSEVYLPPNDNFPTPEDEKTTLLSMDGPLVLVKGINDLKEASHKNTITLFDLSQTDSPYRGSKKLTEVKINFIRKFSPDKKESSITDFTQYILFLRNAKAINPMK